MSEKDDIGLLSLPTMVRWFSPTLLADAAVRAVISPVFGTFADARATQASADGFSADAMRNVAGRYHFDVGTLEDSTGAVWVDYLADTGDGFDATYAMATLVQSDSLTVTRPGGETKYVLPEGRLLIFGGDQVYPYPTRDEYKMRFETPFEMAFPAGGSYREAFVIPGNHDWYDGLNSFDFLFCQARYGLAEGTRIGGLQFRQHRSYFAVRLPHNWWIWGCDIQFSQYLDSGQVRYFSAVASAMRERRPGEPEHKIILCSAEPGWQYEQAMAVSANSNIEIITKIADQCGAKVCAVLSGDTHHYSRYFSKDLGLNLITAGGGGAFLHPTHQLKNEVTYNWLDQKHAFNLRCREPVKPGKPLEIAAFPSRAKSFWLTWLNAFFPVFNYTFATLLGVFYWMMTWLYSQAQVPRIGCSVSLLSRHVDQIIDKDRPLIEDILVYNTSTCGLRGRTFVRQFEDLVNITLQASVHQFLLGVFGMLLFAVLYGYADARTRWKRFLMAFLHWLVHISAMIGLYWLVNHYGYWTYFGSWTMMAARPFIGQVAESLRTVAYMVQMIFGGGIVAGLVWGFYLFVSCAFFKRHWNDAFSSLRLGDYKNFLRLKFEKDRLTIYPIGLKRVPTRLEWHESRTPHGPKLVPLIDLSPHLIDGPIVIDPAGVRMHISRPRWDGALT
jgi:hypothetical protein